MAMEKICDDAVKRGCAKAMLQLAAKKQLHQNKELLSFRRESDSSGAERSEHLEQIFNLQGHLQDREQLLHELQEQEKIVPKLSNNALESQEATFEQPCSPSDSLAETAVPCSRINEILENGSDMSSTGTTVSVMEDEDIGWNNKETTTANTSSTATNDPDIYMRVKRDDVYYWYVINDNTPQKQEKTLLRHFFSKQPHNMDFSAISAIGCTIYMSGGALYKREEDAEKVFPLSCNKVFCMDTRHPRDGWKEVAAMLKRRQGHYAFAEGGKMYVVGGDDVSDGPPIWAEVYNPSSNMWLPLPDLRKYKTGTNYEPVSVDLHAVWDSTVKKEILLYSRWTGEMVSYDINTNLQRLFSLKLGFSIHASAFVDGVFYCIDTLKQDALLAYDPSKPLSCPVLVTGPSDLQEYLPKSLYLEGEPRSKPNLLMVSLGDDKLAVVWALKSLSELSGVPSLIVTCSKFRMLKVTNCESGDVEFKASPVCRSCYEVLGSCIMNCLALPLGDDDKIGVNTEEQATS